MLDLGLNMQKQVIYLLLEGWTMEYALLAQDAARYLDFDPERSLECRFCLGFV